MKTVLEKSEKQNLFPSPKQKKYVRPYYSTSLQIIPGEIRWEFFRNYHLVYNFK